MNRRTVGALGAFAAALCVAAPATAGAASAPHPSATATGTGTSTVHPALRTLDVYTTGWEDSATGRCLDSNAAGQVYTTDPCQTPGNHFQEWVVTDYEFGVEPGSYIFVDQIKDLATGLCLDSNAAGNIYTDACQTPGNYYQLWYEYSGTSGGDADMWRDYNTGLNLDSNAAGSAYTDPPNGGDFQGWVMG